MKLSKTIQALSIATGLCFSPFCFSSPTLDAASLSYQPYWLKLGHYLPALRTDYKSTVDSPEFFLAPDGKTNPKSELRATINALYNANAQKTQEMRCKFPARYTWLEAQLGRTAKLRCPELDKWEQVIDPAGMTLVFPTAFMNNPSSMFGHTLLRVDAKDQTRNKELVAFAINFAAEPNGEDNAAMYALKGMFGSYPGRFTVMPYYRKVREYNDMESRDIWEYKLNLTADEVHRVLLHLWEMQHAEFDYYFFDENCSYQLLALIQLARDDISLVDKFPVEAIPSDTVAALADAGLLEAPKYRAAFGTRLLHQVEELDPAMYEAAKRAKQGFYPSSDTFTPSERAAILEFAYEWLNYEFYDEVLEREPTAKQLTALLRERSKITVSSPFSPVPVPEISPEKGHGSSRAGIGYQMNKEANNQTIFEWRGSYHDLLDSQDGYIPGAQISFVDTQISVEDNHVRLDRLYLVDAMALAPSNKVFDSWAWNIRAGFDRQPNRNEMEGRGFALGGYGKAWGNARTLHTYTLFGAEFSSGELTDDRISTGIGAEAGAFLQVGKQNRLGIQGQYYALLNNDASQHAELKAEWQFSFARDWGVRSQIRYQYWGDDEMSARVMGYFYY